MEFAPEGSAEPEKAEASFEYFVSRQAALKDAKALKIDRLYEWPPDAGMLAKSKDLKLAPYGGEKDLSAQIKTSWDKSFFNIEIAVKDDKLFTMDSWQDAWKGDSIQLYFDSWGDARAKTLKGYDSNDQTYDVWFSGKDGSCQVFRRVAPEQQLAFTKQGLVKDAKSSFRKTEDGYVVEISFPVKELAPIRFENGSSFGFAALVNDNDGDYRKRALGMTPGKEPHLNPDLYPLLILKGKE